MNPPARNGRRNNPPQWVRLTCDAKDETPHIWRRRTRSGPSRKNLLRRHDLFRRTGEIVFVSSGPAGDMDLDGFQAAVLHPQAELFVDFLDTVLLQAIAHASVSVRDGLIAMLNAGYFGRRQTFKQRIKRPAKFVR